MRINAGSKLTAEDVRQAAVVARGHGRDIYVHEIATSPRGAITFYCASMNGRYAVNRPQEAQFGRDRDRAATWTSWGWLIAELFRRDPEAKIGQYKGVQHFRNSCRQMHEWRERSPRKRPYDPGADISFLELVEEVTA